MGEQHTFNRMKSDYFYPEIGDRRAPRDWQDDGARRVGDVAREKAREILSAHFPSHLPDDLDRALRKKFDIRLTRAQIGRAQ